MFPKIRNFLHKHSFIIVFTIMGFVPLFVLHGKALYFDFVCDPPHYETSSNTGEIVPLPFYTEFRGEFFNCIEQLDTEKYRCVAEDSDHEIAYNGVPDFAHVHYVQTRMYEQKFWSWQKNFKEGDYCYARFMDEVKLIPSKSMATEYIFLKAILLIVISNIVFYIFPYWGLRKGKNSKFLTINIKNLLITAFVTIFPFYVFGLAYCVELMNIRPLSHAASYGVMGWYLYGGIAALQAFVCFLYSYVGRLIILEKTQNLTVLFGQIGVRLLRTMLWIVMLTFIMLPILIFVL